ncbi:MAG: hypothetical protein U0K66_09535 [Paludibacteraceae bacterium]|nr:hypothetical protein [Paludibacteraceae bacterium]
MKKTKLLLIFIIVPLVLYLGYQVKIIYNYGRAVQQETRQRIERQLKFATNMEFKGKILQKSLSYYDYEGYYVKINFPFLDLDDYKMLYFMNFLNEWYHFEYSSSSVVWRVSKEEYDSLVVGDSIFKEKGSLVIHKKVD